MRVKGNGFVGRGRLPGTPYFTASLSPLPLFVGGSGKEPNLAHRELILA